MKRLELMTLNPTRRGGPVPVGDVLREVLLELVRQAVREELAELRESLRAPSEPAVVDREQLARVLQVSLATIDRLRKAGMPTVWVADAPRFEVAAVLEYCRDKGAAQ